MSPRGRHKAGSGQPADEPWRRSSDRHVWRAYKHGLVLTVSFQAQDHWVAVVEGEGIYERSPAIATRLACQRWADARANAKAARGGC